MKSTYFIISTSYSTNGIKTFPHKKILFCADHTLSLSERMTGDTELYLLQYLQNELSVENNQYSSTVSHRLVLQLLFYDSQVKAKFLPYVRNFFSMTLNTTEVMRHFLSNFHNICSYNICLSSLSGIQIDAIDLLIISVLRQQRKYSSERKNKGNNK